MPDENAPPVVPPTPSPLPPADPPPVEPDPVLLQLKAEVEKLKADRVESLRKLVGLKYSLPEPVVSRLKGETEADIENDAKTFKSLFPTITPPPPPPAGNPAPANPEQERNGFLEMRQRRGTDYAPL